MKVKKYIDMKTIKIFSLLLTLFFIRVKAHEPFPSSSQQILMITGYAHGFKDSTWLYLDDAIQMGKAIDSAMVLNETFKMKVKKSVSQKPLQYAIRSKSFSDYKLFWVEDQPITISGVKGNFKNAIVDGSVFQQHNQAFERIRLPFSMEIDSLRRNFGTTDSVMLKKIISLEAILKQKTMQLIEESTTSLFDTYLLNSYCREWGNRTTMALYNKMSLKKKISDFGLSIKKYLETNKDIVVGSTFIDFEQNTPEGTPIRLSSFVGKSKYVLLEFWASLCGPCRRENPNLVSLYAQYKNKGFEVFGVSHDISASGWKKAIIADKLPWPNVSVLKGADNDVALIYGIYEIPTNFLIDPSGKIIAKNLRGEDLRKKLKELFDE